MASQFLGIEIGGTKLQLVAGNSGGSIAKRWRFTVDPASGGPGICQAIEQAWSKIRVTTPQLEGVGVGFGGPVDWEHGRIACSHQIEGWSDFELCAWLRALTGLPVKVDNDANVAAYGEALFGAGIGCNPAFYVTLGSGVGGGLVLNGQIYHGAKPGESEIGHVRLDRSGATVESRCSGWAVDAKIRQLKQTTPDCLLSRLAAHDDRGEARHLANACQSGDAAAIAILRESAEDLAFGLSHVGHLFHPEIIILGGGLSLVGEPLRACVAEYLPQYLMKVFAPGPRVVLAGLGEDAVPMGALALARQAGL